MPDLAVILASTRPGRAGEGVAAWVMDQARRRTDATYTLIDLAQVNLPQVDEPLPPAVGRYTHPHTQAWAQTIAAYDGFVIVTPEYNHSYPGALKNALDRVCAEWSDKAVGFVSYGFDGGVRAVEALRTVVGALGMADVQPQTALSMRDDFEGFGRPFAPREHQSESLTAVLDKVTQWAEALRATRG